MTTVLMVAVSTWADDVLGAADPDLSAYAASGGRAPALACAEATGVAVVE